MTFVVADYFLNTAKYAKNCENKAKPMLHCDGKCQLMKKIKAEEKKDQENPERKTENKNEITLFPNSSFASIILPAIESTSASIISRPADGNCVDRSLDIFHPPRA